MYAFSNHLGQKEKIISKASEIARELHQLYEMRADAFEGRSTNQQDIFKRMNLLNEFLDTFLE
jgi:hypothetical protein